MPSTVFSGHKVHSKIDTRAAERSQTVVECVRQLDAHTEATWHSIWRSVREDNRLLDTGYLHPEFSKAVCRVRDDVEFAVVRDDDEIVAIFPFQRIGRHIAHPVGGMMNDFNGVVAKRNSRIDFRSLMSQAGLKRFDFHSLQNDVATESSRSIKTVYRVLDCPYIDLGNDLMSYRQWLRQHSSTVRRQPQKTRAMIRDLGPVSLEFDCRDEETLEHLIEMKRSKFRRTRTFDLLGVPWTSNLLREVFRVRTDEFRGVLSVLRAGDNIVAAHFGIVCGTTLHYWFPAHEHAFGRYSPGTQLMIELTDVAFDQNVNRIDLGYGESELKDRFANGKTTVEYGCYGLNAISRTLRHGQYEVRQALKRIPAKVTVKKFVRPILPNLGLGKFR